MKTKEESDMAAGWIEKVTGTLEEKKQYRQYKARIDALPEPYGTAAKAFQRYFMYYGGITAGDVILQMTGDFADLWERAAADGTPVRAIVGDDPVEFAETFAEAYSGRKWIDKERERLTKAIDAVAGDDNAMGVES
jgi:DNA-binding ferritin-like protein (Dps family)